MVKEASLPGHASGAALNGQNSYTDERRPTPPSMDDLKVVEKCPKCKEIVYIRDWEKNLKVCSRCNHHVRLSAYERIALLVDQGSFVELDKDLVSVDPLHFTTNPPGYADKHPYTEKLAEAQ